MECLKHDLIKERLFDTEFVPGMVDFRLKGKGGSGRWMAISQGRVVKDRCSSNNEKFDVGKGSGIRTLKFLTFLKF